MSPSAGDQGHLATALDDQGSLSDKLSADSMLGQTSSADFGKQKNASAARLDNQFLPAFDMGALALWGANPVSDNSSTNAKGNGSWSDSYAANFDRSDEDRASALKLDMSHAVGLPRGTSKEELLRAADRQEEDLLAQILGA